MHWDRYSPETHSGLLVSTMLVTCIQQRNAATASHTTPNAPYIMHALSQKPGIRVT
jgi:hypothetical protein